MYEGLGGSDWLVTARDKTLVTARAYKVLRINVRSLCRRDAVTGVRAGRV